MSTRGSIVGQPTGGSSIDGIKVLLGFGAILVVFMVISIIIWFMGSSNESTPGGYVGYVTQGATFSKRHFIGTQVGPTSTGKSWLVEVINVSVTPYTFTEEFDREKGTSVMSKDSMQMSFAVHTTFRVNPDRVKDFVEHYTTIHSGESADEIVQNAYNNFLRSRIQNFARYAVNQYPWQEISQNGDVIGKEVSDRVDELTKGTPFDVQAVVIGNIQPPLVVANAVAESQAAGQIFQRKTMEVKQAQADAEKRVAEARGIAEAMELVNGKLTAQYLQYEAIKAQESIATNGSNHSTIYIPTGYNGVPLVGTFDTAATTKPAGK